MSGEHLKVALCWRSDHQAVNPPALAGGLDRCQEGCEASIYVSHQTREIIRQNPGMRLICHVCYRGWSGWTQLMYPTEKQKAAIRSLGGERP